MNQMNVLYHQLFITYHLFIPSLIIVCLRLILTEYNSLLVSMRDLFQAPLGYPNLWMLNSLI